MAGGACPFTLTKKLLYHSFLTGLLLIVVILQGVLLDVYIIYSDHTLIENYFWLVPDFLLVFGFVAAMASGYRSNKIKKSEVCQNDHRVKGEEETESLHAKVLGKHFLPFYIWLVYSILLVAKIAIIFKSQVPNKLDAKERLSPQLLKIAMSLSCIVFALLVEGQTSPEKNFEQNNYIKTLSHGTAFEILDSVTFISLLIQSESRLVLPLTLENAIIFFSCMNFMLPGIALIKLSRCQYGESPVCIVSSVLYKFSHLWFINVTYFIIRVHLWGGLSMEVSPFIVKNIYHIFSDMNDIMRESKPLWSILKGFVNKHKRVQDSSAEDREPTEMTEGIEMNATSSSVEDSATGSDRFEEIDLKVK
ncbi:transmembrane protein 121B-like [Palaemon carinicauda]|uniref:transmembrane protein 121B-like n=1 Tax=Palaemon carinicauda TaxID=392227 RepID=UPI0035B576AC